MITQLRLIGLTILLTALIWSSADQVGEATDTLPVRITVIEDGQWIVSPNTRSCTAVFRGTKRAIQSLRNQTADGVLAISQLADELGLEPGTETLDLTNLVGHARVVTELGLTVSEIEPTTIQIDVDRLEPHVVPVRHLSAGAALATPPSIDPPEVTATVPSLLWEENRENLDVVYAQISLDELIGAATAGQAVEEQVAVTVPEALKGRPITFEPRRVRVRFEVRDDQVRQTFARVPIRVIYTEPAQRQFWVDKLDPLVVDVTLAGPPESMARLSREQQEVRVGIELTTDDLASAGEPSRRQLQIFLPPWATGVQLAPGEELPTVAYEIAKREPGG